MHRPALWLACSFAAGIAVCSLLHSRPFLPAAVLALLSGAAGVFIGREGPASAASLAAVFMAGACVHGLQERCLDCSDLRVLCRTRPVFLAVRGTLLEAPSWEKQEGEGGGVRGRGRVRIRSVRTGRGWEGLSGEARCTCTAEKALDLRAGDRIEARGLLQRVRAATNPGQYDAASFWRRRGIEHTFALKGNDAIRLLDRGGWRSASAWVAAVRGELKARLDAGMPEGPAARIVRAMILGIRESMGEEISRPFRITNTMHILAISGLHVGFFFLVVRGSMALLRVPRRAASVAAIPLIGAYAVLTGLAVPVRRAAIMFVALLAAPIAKRQRDALNALGTAALVILAGNPLALFDTGFRLSFAAVLSLLILSAPIAALLRRGWRCGPLPGQLLIGRGERVRWWLGRRAIELVSASVATWIGMAPLIASSFHIATAQGVLGNIVVIPAGFAIVCLGFAGLLASLLSAALGAFFSGLACRAAGAMLAAIGAISRIPCSWTYVRAPGKTALCAYYAMAAGALLLLNGRARGGWKAAILCAMLVLPLFPVLSAIAPPVMSVTFLDVGQGDAICLRLPCGETVLVDAGPGGAAAAGRRVVCPFLESEGCSRVDLALLTHAHDDHYGGFEAVFGDFDVAQSVTGDAECGIPRPRGPPWEGSGRTAFVTTKRGDRISSGCGVGVAVLNPDRRPYPPTSAGQNDSSIALMVSFGRTRMLLCGDMERDAEEDLCRSGMDLKADVLKVGHHGGASSCTEEFLRRVSPRWAIVSAGEGNRFGHPSPATMARLREAGVTVYRTDLHGAVTFVSDGAGWEATTFR